MEFYLLMNRMIKEPGQREAVRGESKRKVVEFLGKLKEQFARVFTRKEVKHLCRRFSGACMDLRRKRQLTLKKTMNLFGSVNLAQKYKSRFMK